jgi:hypothetical protein
MGHDEWQLPRSLVDSMSSSDSCSCNISVPDFVESCWCHGRRPRGARLAVREARLITKELRQLGVGPRTIAKIWAFVIAVPVVVVLGYLLVHYDSGTANPAVLAGVQITPKDKYNSHVLYGTSITLKTLTVTCYPGGDAQPLTSGRSIISRPTNRDSGSPPACRPLVGTIHAAYAAPT